MAEMKMPPSVPVARWDRLSNLFEEQRQLQERAYGYDPTQMQGDERIQFIKDMTLALNNELNEFLDEIGWKPWATSRHVNEQAAKGELVDMFHFFMNLCMVVHMSPDELYHKYMEKRQRNEQRQVEGYDGIAGKCAKCKRDFGDIAVAAGVEKAHRNWFSQTEAVCDDCYPRRTS